MNLFFGGWHSLCAFPMPFLAETTSDDVQPVQGPVWIATRRNMIVLPAPRQLGEDPIHASDAHNPFRRALLKCSGCGLANQTANRYSSQDEERPTSTHISSCPHLQPSPKNRDRALVAKYHFGWPAALTRIKLAFASMGITTMASSHFLSDLPSRPHALTATEVLAKLDVSSATGLSEEQVASRVNTFGPNTISVRRKISALSVLLHQFQSPVVYLLAFAAVLAIYFGESEEGGAIAAVLIVNSLIGFITEIKAARSIEALRALGTQSARVRRAGHTRLIPAAELVPGDIVIVAGGDSISADVRIAQASHLGVDESTLTGESVPVEKTSEAVGAETRLAERTSMLFKGTLVARGSGVGVVVATGMATELGLISKLVEAAKPEPSPLERGLARLSAQLLWVVVILAGVLGVIGIATGKDPFSVIEAAVALAVAAIPEGLPIVATLALGRGMWRMAHQNALVERLSAVETLGATTVILTDKTGTLTENQMTVRRLWVGSGEGVIDWQIADAPPTDRFANDPRLIELIRISVLCNEATLEGGDHESSGDPMEVALLRAGRACRMERRELLQSAPMIRIHAFDARDRMMATVHRSGDRFVFAVKGAPEAVLAVCEEMASKDGGVRLDDATRSQWLQRIEQFGQDGLRVIACAMKIEAVSDTPPYRGLTFLGLIGLEDPARADVPRAIRNCREAGIRVVMVTGDHAVTARSIGLAVGLADAADTIVQGPQLHQLAHSSSRELKTVAIFARVSPAEKLALVRAYQSAGEIVAMTGDGVNDAPALRQADIGVAMGLRGTDVAREAAAMVLLDDAFPTIVTAIREGRIIFDNIRKSAAYLLSCNLTEVLVVGMAIISTMPLPILPLQILYLNLVTDVFPAFALAMGEGNRDILRCPPRDPKESILGPKQWATIVVQSLTMMVATLAASAIASLGLDLDARSTVTVTFLTLAFAQLWHVFNMGDSDKSLLENEVVCNPWIWGALALCAGLTAAPPYIDSLAHILHLTPPTVPMWAIIIGASLAPMIFLQLLKYTRGS
jgi:P-type Ca2+ transporter type 2C